jgi:RND family efflux transporter MFP subunit
MVYAPIDGVVSTRNVEIGQIISSGINNIGGGTTLLTVADLSRIYVLASVDESDIGCVRVGYDASMTVDAHADRRFRGLVERIATKGETSSNVVTFEVKIQVTDARRALLKPEMTANIDIVIASSDDALLVPSQAVTKTRDGYVVKVDEGQEAPASRTVEIGIRSETTIEVVSGLEEGERVVLGAGLTQSKWKSEKGGRRGPRLFGGHGKRGKGKR